MHRFVAELHFVQFWKHRQLDSSVVIYVQACDTSSTPAMAAHTGRSEQWDVLHTHHVMRPVYPAVCSIGMLHLQACSATASVSLGVGL